MDFMYDIKSKKILKEYKEQIFECIDDSYSKLLGTVLTNDKLKAFLACLNYF